MGPRYTEAELEYEGTELDVLDSLELESCFVDEEGSEDVILLLRAHAQIAALFSTDRSGAEWLNHEDHMIDIEFMGEQFALVRSEHTVSLDFSVNFNKVTNSFSDLEFIEGSARSIRRGSG
jgi:hypothetical protein